jgi:hypothetical protein
MRPDVSATSTSTPATDSEVVRRAIHLTKKQFCQPMPGVEDHTPTWLADYHFPELR